MRKLILLSVLTIPVGAQVPAGFAVNGCTVGGTANAITCTNSPAIAALTDGLTVWFKATSANTGAATFQLDSTTAAAIYQPVGSTLLNALAANDIRPAQWVGLKWDATNSQWQMVSPKGTSPTASGGGGYQMAACPAAAPSNSSGVYYPLGGGPSASSTIAARQTGMARSGTVKRIQVNTSTAVPGTGDLVFTLMQNGTATGLALTVPAGSGANTYDASADVAFVAGDLLTTRVATPGSVTIVCIVYSIE